MEDPKQTLETSFGAAIYAARVARGWSQRDLCDRAALSIGYLSSVENERSWPPPRSATERLIRALEFDTATSEQLLALAQTERELVGLRLPTDTPAPLRAVIIDLLRERKSLTAQAARNLKTNWRSVCGNR